MWWLSIMILSVLAMTLMAVVVASVRILSAMRKGRMLAECHGYGSEAMSQTGVSVVVSGRQTEREIEQRLSSEYWRYEVIVVVDSTLDAQLLRTLCRKYALIRVSFPATDELPIDGAPLLYRSRQRRYRRLVVVDRLHRSRADDWNCGVVVASFERIVPLESDRFLIPDALPRWVMELHERKEHHNEVLSAFVAPTHFFDWQRVAMFSRSAVIEAGGFVGEHPRRVMIRRLRGDLLHLPLACSTSRHHRPKSPLQQIFIALGSVATVALFANIACQNWDGASEALMLVVATYATSFFASTVALRTRLAVRADHDESHVESLRRLLRCSFRVY